EPVHKVGPIQWGRTTALRVPRFCHPLFSSATVVAIRGERIRWPRCLSPKRARKQPRRKRPEAHCAPPSLSSSLLRPEKDERERSRGCASLPGLVCLKWREIPEVMAAIPRASFGLVAVMLLALAIVLPAVQAQAPAPRPPATEQKDINRPGDCLSADAGGLGPDLPHPPLGCLLPLQALLSLLGPAFMFVREVVFPVLRVYVDDHAVEFGFFQCNHLADLSQMFLLLLFMSCNLDGLTMSNL
ncbi:hypothetical protein MUK42_16050, partial [Musa troglodytarum]